MKNKTESNRRVHLGKTINALFFLLRSAHLGTEQSGQKNIKFPMGTETFRKKFFQWGRRLLEKSF